MIGLIQGVQKDKEDAEAQGAKVDEEEELDNEEE
jgi:hypothetical protein